MTLFRFVGYTVLGAAILYPLLCWAANPTTGWATTVIGFTKHGDKITIHFELSLMGLVGALLVAGIVAGAHALIDYLGLSKKAAAGTG